MYLKGNTIIDIDDWFKEDNTIIDYELRYSGYSFGCGGYGRGDGRGEGEGDGEGNITVSLQFLNGIGHANTLC
jgi:hypothetical protein